MSRFTINERVPEALHAALLHAVEQRDKFFLNRIELELVRHFKIQPSDHCIASMAPDAGDVEWRAAGICGVGNELAVLWRSDTKCDCRECDGTGTLEAHGNKRSYEMDCPECDGTGQAEDGDEYTCWSGIDGEPLAANKPDEEVAYEPIGLSDPLTVFQLEQKKKEKEIA